MNHRMLRSLASTALAAGLLAGCASTAPHPGQSASRAQSALDGGQTSKAVALAEQAALADPRNPGYRMLLGSAYMREGRFESARQAYDDAMELGEDGGKAALSLALTDIALGHGDIAIDTLNAHQAQIPVADYGLALALAGHAPQAVAVLEQALRTSEPSPKLRQNCAYALAMSGQWREAREMAAQDVPADQLTQRMAEWAQLNDPANMRLRVAGVLGVPMRIDQGQPTALALANFPANAGQAVATAAEPQAPAAAVPSAQAPALASFAAQELPALDNGAAQPQVADASSAPAAEKLAVLDAALTPGSACARPARRPAADGLDALGPAGRAGAAALAPHETREGPGPAGRCGTGARGQAACRRADRASRRQPCRPARCLFHRGRRPARLAALSCAQPRAQELSPGHYRSGSQGAPVLADPGRRFRQRGSRTFAVRVGQGQRRRMHRPGQSAERARRSARRPLRQQSALVGVSRRAFSSRNQAGVIRQGER